MKCIMERPTEAWVEWCDAKGRKHVYCRSIPEPDHYASNGCSHIETYVRRLLHSTEHFSSLMVSTPDGEIALGILKLKDHLQIGLSVDVTNLDEEQTLRKFFADRSIEPTYDYLAQNGNVPDSVRMLDYPLPADIQFVTDLAKNLLANVYGVDERAALDFAFKETSTRPRLVSRIRGIVFGWLFRPD
ncbi:MAG: hypothetical protein KJ060_09365 [Candidatus Hydrogenedentes bacterium]|nr:hypothetical protein [Candidatus Hydrogenedentota bacterium]